MTIHDYEQLIQRVEHKHGIHRDKPFLLRRPQEEAEADSEPPVRWHYPLAALCLAITLAWAGWLGWMVCRGIYHWVQLRGGW